MSNKIREGFHEAYPDAERFYHEPTGRYASMRYNDMYDAWVKAIEFAKPLAEGFRLERELQTIANEG